jgi:uncharacterized protein DUF6049
VYDARAAMRRLATSLGSALLGPAFLIAILPAPAAGAQEPGPVRLTLVRQTPWNEPGRPLRLEVRATNEGLTSLRELTLTVTIAERVISRTAYLRSLDEAATLTLDTVTFPLPGRLPAGESLTVPVERDAEAILSAALRHETGVFPVGIELRSAGQPLAELRTPMVYLATDPENPLSLAWTFVLHEPIGFGPDGTFLTTSLERAVAEGATLSTQVSAVARMLSGARPRPVDVVLSPPLLRQLEAMADGYRVLVGTEVAEVPEGEAGAADAARVLEKIRSIARAAQTEVAALPFAAPSVPAMLQANLRGDLQEQVDRGAADIERLTGAAPDRELFAPPDGLVDQDTLSYVASGGAELALLEAGRVQQPPQDRGFAPPPTGSISTGLGRSITAVLPNPDLHAMLASGSIDEDPRLGVQTALGMLATIWLEQPGTARGVAIMVSRRLPLPAQFFEPFVQATARAPWLRPVRASSLAARIPPPGRPLELSPIVVTPFSEEYVAQLERARDRVDTFRSMLVGEATEPAALETGLLLAEAGAFVGLERGGEAFIDNVEATVNGFLGAVAARAAGTVTLASRTGIITVALANETGRAVRVTVRLRSTRLRFLQDASREVVLDRPTTTLAFQVEARSTGQFPVSVTLAAPDGVVFSERPVVVRSTAYSRVALIVTLGAALFLVLSWGRRFLPGRSSARAIP